ncbi:MAG: haloacid dehalogenase-like hydrolase, partial [Alphaproteobacteria bacterium]|nr:haloacid dehalogenase-like hydrolase [Alphaproteobacteria bacterium]
MKRRSFLVGSAGLAFSSAPFVAKAQPDALPSWNEGPAKQALLDFVARTTAMGDRDWIPVPERITCFDNDGTLWTEQPMYVQVTFAMDRVRALASRNPQWRTQEP